MMTDCSTRASSDSESNASRTQRQAVGGAPQARSGVERVNQRGNEGGMSEVVRSSFETPCSDENVPSTSQRLQQMRNECRGQFAGVKLGVTRAALDQRRREQRALLHMKTMRIWHLKKRCKEIAADVNNQFDQLSERLLQYRGDPNWLIECFAVVFNDSAATVMEYEKEIKKLYREVAEHKHAVYKKVQVKKNGPSVSSVQNSPAVTENVPEASSVPTVAGFLVHHNPFTVLDHKIHLAGMNMDSDSDDEEMVPLLDPRRNRSDHSVSSLVQKQETSAGELPAESNINIQPAYGNKDQNCPSPSVFQMNEDNPVQSENTPQKNPQTMSRSKWKPREPPTFTGRLKEDVHQWTAIVTQYFTLVPGTNQQQLTYAVSLLRGFAIEWYNAEVKKDNPADWKSLSKALILRFGSTARSKRALLKIMQLKQDKDDVLQYAAKFESLKAQMETYDEQMLLMRFIFGLKDDLIEPVFMQYPKTVQEAKQVAENIEIVHQGVERHEKSKTAKGQNQTSNKKRGKKGILGNSSVVRGQSSNQSAGFKTRSRKTRNSFASVSCNISRNVYQNSVQNSLYSRPLVQKGTVLDESSDRKCAAAKWREFIRPLSHRERAGVWRSYVKKRGSIVVADLEALTCVKEPKTAVVDAGKKQYHKSSNDRSSSDTQRTRSTRSHQSNRLLRREKERLVREQVRERRIVARLLATRVSPSDGGQSGGTGLRTTVTTSALQDWSSTQMKSIEPGTGGLKTSQKQLTSVAVHQSIDREIEDGILLVVPVRIQGREYRALIDSGATRSFISPACITETGSKTRKNNTFLELGNGWKVLSKFEAMGIPVVIAGRTFKIDFTVSDLLHNVDIVLGYYLVEDSITLSWTGVPEICTFWTPTG